MSPTASTELYKKKYEKLYEDHSFTLEENSKLHMRIMELQHELDRILQIGNPI